MAPYLQDPESSPARSEQSLPTRTPSYPTVIDDAEYPALSFPGYAEKPLSEQLEPIAVVGMGCRLPGEVHSLSEFWNLTMNKGTGRTPKVPSDRFNIDGHFHPNNERPGSFNVLGGYFLKRKLLEVVYEAFESAGVSLEAISGSTTAVFAGSFTSDYQQMSFKEPDSRHSYAATGVDPGIISNRISHVFNLHGPSISVPALLLGVVSLIITVDQHMNTAKLGVLSHTSTCRTFDESADGYGRADGVGGVYLKRLSDAVRDGDSIRGILPTEKPLLSVSLTPTCLGQKDVIQHAYRRGGDLDPRLTGYFEIHGTGTPIDDPLEVNAVARVMNDKITDADEPLLIGAVKTNIGHSGAASGLSAVIKACLTVENGIIPPTRGLVKRNPKINWKDWKRVSVNSFGYGGTNGHIIVEGVDSFLPDYKHGKKTDVKPEGDELNRPYLFPMSAHNKPTLKQNIAAYEKIVDQYDPLDLTYTLANRRSRFSTKGYVVATPATIPSAFGNDAAAFAIAEKKKTNEVGFAFTGRGAQWATMGSQLMKYYYPSFLATIRKLDQALPSPPDAPEWTLEATLLQPAATSRVNEADFSPGATESIIVAYYRGQAVKTVNTNGAMMAVGLGAEAAEPYLTKYEGKVVIACHNSPSSVTISGDAPALAEIKAAMDAESIFARLVKTSGKAYHSHHMKPSADTYKNFIQKAKSVVSFGSPLSTGAVMVSSVTNSRLTEGSVVDENYWCQNLISPVLFNQAVQTLASSDDLFVDALIEIGPHTALSGPIKQSCKEFGYYNLGYMPTLVRNEDSAAQLLKVAGELYLGDYPINLETATAIEQQVTPEKIKLLKGKVLVDLSTYKWHYPRKLWAEPRQSLEHRSIKHTRHDVLGLRMPGCSAVEPVWRNVLRIRDVPWPRDHSLGGEAGFPAAACQIDGFVLRDVSIKAALVTPDDDDSIEVMFSLRRSIFTEAERGQWWDFDVSSVSAAGHWNDHVTGTIGINARQRGQTPRKIPNLPQRATGKAWNDGLKEVGFDYGPSFQGMVDVQSDGKNYIAATHFDIKQESGVLEAESRYVLHPGTVDLCLQLIIVSIYAGKLNDMTCGAVPVQVDEVAIWPPSEEQLKNPAATAFSFTDQRGIRSFVSGSQLVANDGELLMDITDMRCVAYEAAVPQRAEEATEPQPYQETVWKVDIDNSLAWADKVDDLTVARLVESLAHKAPGSKVLEIGSENTASILEEPFQINYTVVEASDEAVEATKAKFTDAKGFKVEKLDISAPLADEDVSGTYDLVIATGKVGATELENIRKLVSAGGRLVVKEVPAGFENVEIFVEKDGKVAFAKDAAADEALASKEVTLVYRNEPASIVSTVEEELTKAGFVTKRSRLDSLEAKDGESVIIVGDLEGSPLLATINEKEFEGVKHLTSTASSILWVTAGGILTGKKPEYAMTNGLARSSKKNDIHETGYVVSSGLVYVSRLVANRGASINTVKSTPVPTPFTEGQSLVAAAQQGKITWTADKREHDPLNAGEIEVKLSYGGLNKEDTVVINGKDYPTTFSHEISGTITKVGCGVTDLKVGDVVVGFAFDKFATFQRTSADLVLKVEKDEDVTKLASLPWSFAQAIYGLETLARVEPGETVLILSNTGAVGAATLKVAQALSAKPFIVTDSEADASALVSKFGIAREQVVIPTISSLARDYKALTNGRGFDVILSGGYTDPVLAQRPQACSPRHYPLHQSASYLSYDILDLYAHKPQILAYLLKSAVTLFRKDPSVLVEDTEVYNVADLESAVSSFSDSVLSSKKVIAYTASEKTLEVVPTAPTLRFSPDATYFLVGCLGGLGRSLTSWMTENGARHFAFLGRSERGIHCQVIRGDVASKEDVERAVASIPKEHPIRGVVQAAMVLRDGLFHSMTYNNWTTCTRPKVNGTLNLHEVLADRPLDFFVTTSSTSGTLGTPGQGDYSAANSFLDSMARYRVNHGKKACSIFLPMVLGVGYVAEHPEVEEALRRKGIYSIDETHLLESFATSMLVQSSENPVDHVVVGLDPVKLQKSINSADPTDGFWLEDTRFKTLLESMKSADAAGSPEASRTILTTIRTAASAAEAVQITSDYFTQKLSRLLILDLYIFEPRTKAIADYGLDSMIGAELRNWIFKELGLDIPFQRLLGPELTIWKFAIEVCANQGQVLEGSAKLIHFDLLIY
ncbi:Acyl transferase/acyl hydrolase/lysophospholipase [Penicillium occitanis (nom. inval.)]|nr:hypothetical protein PENOC_097320 [Penicillium occitanis (nom. inval.)]PCG97805.1 Acyl transferase/acyl hydrolase/lysophospholipase [Penicillium occitanis (nom. inval.)]